MMQENVRRKRVAELEEALADRASRFESTPAGNAVQFGLEGEWEDQG